MLLNKIDLVPSKSDLDRIEARLKGINPFAPIQRCQQSEVSVDSVLNIGGFDLKRTLEKEPDFLTNDGEHQHDTSVTSLSITQRRRTARRSRLSRTSSARWVSTTS